METGPGQRISVKRCRQMYICVADAEEMRLTDDTPQILGVIDDLVLRSDVPDARYVVYHSPIQGLAV
jgi:hypothetical protein